MIVPLLFSLSVLQPVQADSVRVCVRDAATGVPLVGARLRTADGATRTLAGDCDVVPSVEREVTVLRLGYQTQVVRWLEQVPLGTRSGQSRAWSTVVIRMLPQIGSATSDSSIVRLATQQVTADAPTAARIGGVSATLNTDEARARGLSTMNGIIGVLPYTSLRSARGESGLSLRGARREQVVITLDGLPLNDPATGLADVADVPLAALQSATVLPGADPVNSGTGANGGVLALASGGSRLFSLRTGAFGHLAAEGAYAIRAGDTRWRTSFSHLRANNDFSFVNAAGDTPAREVRVNNDERRTVLTTSVVTARTQWLALASVGERGMVGAANVRAYDEDRSHTTRIFLRGQTAIGGTLLMTGVRHFALRYRDESRPVLNSEANAWASDAEWRGGAWRGAWRLGIGADGLRGTGSVVQQRSRAFAAWSWQPTLTAESRLVFDVGARADVIERSGVQPTAVGGVTWRALGSRNGSSWSLHARGAQAVRVPTLYDLYFSSPQRLAVRALDPERVTHDLSAGTQLVWQQAGWRAVAEGTLVSRDTRNAIVWFPGNFGWSPANVGFERLRGSESRIDLSSRRASVSAWHTWYRSELRSGSLLVPTPYVPLHSLAANTAWRVGAHTVSANVRRQGRRPFTAGPRNPLFELPAVTITDVAWSQRRVFAHVDVLWSVSLDNVTNVQWQSVRGFPMPGRGWSASLTFAPRP